MGQHKHRAHQNLYQSVYRQFADFELWMIWALLSYIRPGNEIIIDQIRKPAYLVHSGAGISAWNRKSGVSSFQICPITTYVNSALSWMKIYYFRWFFQKFYSISRLYSILHFTWLQILLLIPDLHFIFLAERFSHFAMLICYALNCWLCKQSF